METMEAIETMENSAMEAQSEKEMTLHADSAYLLSLLTSRHYTIAIEVKKAMH